MGTRLNEKLGDSSVSPYISHPIGLCGRDRGRRFSSGERAYERPFKPVYERIGQAGSGVTGRFPNLIVGYICMQGLFGIIYIYRDFEEVLPGFGGVLRS